MLTTHDRSFLYLTLTSICLVAGCANRPERSFQQFVEDFEAKYRSRLTEGDELFDVRGEVEVFNGITGALKYTVKRVDEEGNSENVVMQSDYRFRDDRWRYVRTFPLYEGDFRDLHRERSKQEQVSALLIDVADY